ncbi:MAG: hypothetical protein AAGA77_17390 [Bacteroidota bacterium]
MKHIDKLFKEKLYHHEVEVPEGMWEKIAPIAEEESGRAILWFWFAGLIALLLGSYGMYKIITASNQEILPNTLVYQNEINDTQNSQVVDNNLTINQDQNNLTPENELATALEEVNAEIKRNKSMGMAESNQQEAFHAKKQTTTKASSHKTEQKPIIQSTSSPIISNTVERITNVVGVPADLVITKSYVNKDGSVIKQSNITDETGNNGPIYDVIINSEAKDLNAGALLRIIEPLEDIPLPAFQKGIKKKTQKGIL